MANGYGQSKCIAEQILAKGHAASGLRVAIVRAAQVGGPSSPIVVYNHWPVPGWLYVMIKTSDKLGYWPTHVTALEWIPVDALAEGITNITATEPNDNCVKVYNMMHPYPAPWSLFLGVHRRRFGLSVQEINLPKWLDMANPQKFKLYAFLRAAKEGREHTMAHENRNALELLPEVKAIDEKQLETWMEGWKLKLGETKARL
jgi:thioester reductase-like protein